MKEGAVAGQMVSIIDTPKLPLEQGKAKLSSTIAFTHLAGDRNSIFRMQNPLRDEQLRNVTRAEFAKNNKMISRKVKGFSSLVF